MARRRRIQLPDLPVHAVIRGNDRKAIFRSEGDRIYFHRCLVEATKRYEVEVHAYVLMTNHVHILATGSCQFSLSRAIQWVGRKYVASFNYLYERTGTLWEGRFRSCAVETNRYLLACHRYIELNPVRAEIVRAPGEFLWSSYRSLGLGVKDDLVSPHRIYLDLAAGAGARCKRYRDLFDQHLSAETVSEIRDSLNRGLALGSEDFCRRLERDSGQRVTAAKMGRPARDHRPGDIGELLIS
jgi:REP-associated tyrosine transposase